MIKDVMTFLPKPERNGIWILRIGTPGRAKTNASISTLAATPRHLDDVKDWRVPVIPQAINSAINPRQIVPRSGERS